MLTYFKILSVSLIVILASLGLGRFGYGMILPDLQNSLDLSHTQTGLIGTINFIGYLLALFFITMLYKRFETNQLVFTSLLLQATSMMLMTLFSDYLIISFFYGLCGFFTAISNVAIMVYISHIIPSHIKGRALGVIVAGNGFAIIFAGFLIPSINANFLSSSWKISWIIFALLTAFIAFCAKKGLIYHDDKQQEERQKELPLNLFQSSKFYKIVFLYFVFGVTYVIYVTFFVTASIEKYQISSLVSGYFWSLLGFMSLFSGLLFGYLADKMGAYKTLIIVYVFQTIAHVILAVNLDSSFLFVSAVLFGLTAWAVPPLIALLTTQEFGVRNTAKVFSMATIIFAVGQILGPLGAGYLHDIQNNFSDVFMLCALLTLIAALFSSIFSIKKKS